FAEAITAIVSQQLLPRKDDQGRIAAVEVMIGTPAVRECLRDPSRIAEVRRHMAEARGKLAGQTYEQHLEELVQAGEITADTAKVALAPARPAGPARVAGTKAAKQPA